jgi:molybdenum-dependent DNA-binding transcriptional regulator ModE
MVASFDGLWFNGGMDKQKAIELLGGSVTAAATAIGISYHAVAKWPDVLPRRIADRVEAALYRQLTTKNKRRTKAC